MKTKIFMACLIGILAASTNIYAKTDHKTSPGYSTVIRDFIQSHINSDYKKLDQVLDDDASFKLPRGEKVLVQSKQSLVDMMKNDKGAQQNCTSGYEVLAKSDAMVIARVDFKYENCTQHDFVILEKNTDKQWKITQVCKLFEDIKNADAPADVTASN